MVDPHKALREWRGDRSLVSVARLIGIDPSYVRYLETDPGREVSVTVAMKIEAATGIPVKAWGKVVADVTSASEPASAAESA